MWYGTLVSKNRRQGDSRAVFSPLPIRGQSTVDCAKKVVPVLVPSFFGPWSLVTSAPSLALTQCSWSTRWWPSSAGWSSPSGTLSSSSHMSLKENIGYGTYSVSCPYLRFKMYRWPSSAGLSSPSGTFYTHLFICL